MSPVRHMAVRDLRLERAMPAPRPDNEPSVLWTGILEPEPVAALVVAAPPVAPAPVRDRIDGAVLTFYVCRGAPPGLEDGFCGTMAGGATVYEGAAACGYALQLGTRFRIEDDPTGRVYVCEDRGWLAATQADVFWWEYSDGRVWRDQLPPRATLLLD